MDDDSDDETAEKKAPTPTPAPAKKEEFPVLQGNWAKMAEQPATARPTFASIAAMSPKVSTTATAKALPAGFTVLTNPEPTHKFNIQDYLKSFPPTNVAAIQPGTVGGLNGVKCWADMDDDDDEAPPPPAKTAAVQTGTVGGLVGVTSWADMVDDDEEGEDDELTEYEKDMQSIDRYIDRCRD
jgi:hypothetical protein